MVTTQPQVDRDQIAKRGHDIFKRLVLPFLRTEDNGKFVATYVVSGEYEIDEDDYTAIMRLSARCPAAEIWLECVGQATATKIRCAR